MSFSHDRYPFEACSHPTFEPEVRRAMLASWASNAGAAPDRARSRQASQPGGVIAVDALFDAPRAQDHGSAHHGE